MVSELRYDFGFVEAAECCLLSQAHWRNEVVSGMVVLLLADYLLERYQTAGVSGRLVSHSSMVELDGAVR